MEHENVYLMMMAALDGELTAGQQAELETHLLYCIGCRREWQALVAIDTLFRQTPALSPAADFTQRTLARLPNRRYRVWLISLIYVLLLLSGTLPLVGIVWLIGRFGPTFGQPALLGSLLTAVDNALQVTGAVVRALVGGLGEFVMQQPTVIGWLIVMVGVVVLWSGVYRQLTGAPSFSHVTNRPANR
jgi:anti-sigma factor RsiW